MSRHHHRCPPLSGLQQSTLIVLLLGWLPGAAAAAVFRCDSAGVPRFSQFPCPGGAAVALVPAQTVSVTPLSDAERARLADLEREQQRDRERQRSVLARAAERARQERAERREQCAAARAERAALARQRRKGYSLGEARGLNRRDAEIEARIRDNC